MQIYFMGGDNNIQTDRRCQNIPGVRRAIVSPLQEMFHQNNNLVKEFKTLQNMPNNEYNVVIRANHLPRADHAGRYNAPTTNEVAILIIGNEFGNRDIVFKKQNNTLIRVADTHRFYDTLQYPIIFGVTKKDAV